MDIFLEILEIIAKAISKLLKLIYVGILWMFELLKNLAIKKLDDAGVINAKEKRLFIFGMPHAGKSTMTAALVKYLNTEDEFTFRRDPVSNKYGVKVIRDWAKDYNNGSFPLQTPKDEYTKLLLEYQRDGEEKPNRLVIYEIAGEDVIKFDPTHDQHNSIPLELTEFLRDSKGIIILASSQPDRHDEPEVVQDFIELLLRKKLNKPICFILTKYDLIENDHENHIQAAKETYNGAIKLLKQYDQSSVLAFSVGNVSDNKITKDKSLKYSSKILNWIESI